MSSSIVQAGHVHAVNVNSKPTSGIHVFTSQPQQQRRQLTMTRLRNCMSRGCIYGCNRVSRASEPQSRLAQLQSKLCYEDYPLHAFACALCLLLESPDRNCTRSTCLSVSGGAEQPRLPTPVSTAARNRYAHVNMRVSTPK